MYIAKQSFKASNGKNYRMGDVLTTTEYHDLSSSDRNKVQKKDDDSSSLTGGILMGDAFNTGIPGGLDLDMTTLW